MKHSKHVRPALLTPDGLQVALGDAIGEGVLSHLERRSHLVFEFLPAKLIVGVDVADEKLEDGLELGAGGSHEDLGVGGSIVSVRGEEGDNVGGVAAAVLDRAGLAGVGARSLESVRLEGRDGSRSSSCCC